MTTAEQETSEHPAPEDIREQVERILNSPAFVSNDRRRGFLRYVVEETLAGRASQLKGFSIAVAVLGRDESFDPQTDPVVRLEARRLRREMEHYYLTEGRDHPVRITIPKGTYVPTFDATARTPEPPGRHDGEEPHPQAEEHKSAAPLRVGVSVSAVLAFTLLGVLWLILHRGPGSEMPVGEAAAPPSETPVVAVLPLQKVGAYLPVDDLPAGLTEDIVTDLSRIAGLRVIALGSSSRFGDGDPDVSAVGKALGASHLLLGSFQTDGEVYRVNARLVSVASRQQIWARRFDYSTERILSTQGEIAAEVAGALSVSLIPAENPSTRSGLSSLAARSLYRQALTLINPPSEPARFTASRTLLDRVIELEPTSSDGYAGLAFIVATSLWFGHTDDNDLASDEVDRLASEAIAIDPSNAQARLALALVAVVKGDHDQAIALCRDAIALRPSSSHAHAYLGTMLFYAGRASEAIEPLKEAIRLNPANPRTPFVNMLGVAHLHAGDYAAALAEFQRNIARNGPFGPHVLAWMAAAHAALGETAEEQAILTELRSSPDAAWVAGWFERSFKDLRDIEGPLAALAKAGHAGQRRASRAGASPSGR